MRTPADLLQAEIERVERDVVPTYFSTPLLLVKKSLELAKRDLAHGVTDELLLRHAILLQDFEPLPEAPQEPEEPEDP